MTQQMLMKDGLGDAAVKRLAANLWAVQADFPYQPFLELALQGLQELELKERVIHIIAALHQVFPEDFKQTAGILHKCSQQWQAGDPDDPLRGFAAWPLIDYVGVHGLQQPALALDTLKKLTSLFSAEFAIRPFLLEHRELSLKRLHLWSRDKDEHVRRLVSEGCRPRLPWGIRLQPFCEDPGDILPLLEALKADESLYVRRSVANNLNDISKDHPELVLDVCHNWNKGADIGDEKGGKNDGKQSVDKDRQWLIRHATRTLVKAGHPRVFSLLGYTDKPEISLSPIKLQQEQIVLGEALQFNVQLHATGPKPQKLVLDYAIHHMKANGQTSPKVFKLKNLTLKAGEKLSIDKKHMIKEISTRKYYSGTHKLEILINGLGMRGMEFELEV